ncbi:DMT family transporter [Oceanobacter antarcticus]|uniref:DMT family transporter n=1 Tax=Oceanobacter antarcticus TaxID=3133425 RepID=A0ABW8NMJ9_9GAMM
MSVNLVLLCVAAGSALSTQSGINARLSAGLQSPLLAALVSFGTGTLVLALLAGVMGHYHLPESALTTLPWWAWTGGILGAFIIASIVYVAPQVGALALAVGIVVGQVLASLLFDQFGLLGYPQINVTPQRLAGAGMILVGLWLVVNK